MDINDILIDAFERIKGVVHRSAEGLSDKQLTERPNSTGNSIAWLLWHLTRVQDDHVSELAGKEQVWTAGGWYEKLGLPFDASATGYGHTSKEVAKVTASAELLVGYYDAVHEKTVEFIKNLKPHDYEKIVDTNWDPPVTLAVRLVSVLSDDLQHSGQAAYVRGLL